jgi:glutathione peroxidase
MESIYQFTCNNSKGEAVALSQFKGKTVLFVNIASKCGFTPQLKGLEDLYKTYKAKGLEIIAFPSNDFNQEPLNASSAASFCELNYGVSFPVMEKIRLKGPNVHPLYKFLGDKSKNGKTNIKPLWNFHKYVVDKNGFVKDYFMPFTNPTSAKVKAMIEACLR